MAVCAVTDDPKMVKTLFAPKGNGNECNLVVGEAAVVSSSLCQLMLRMSQLTLGVAVAQSETTSKVKTLIFSNYLACRPDRFF